MSPSSAAARAIIATPHRAQTKPVHGDWRRIRLTLTTRIQTPIKIAGTYDGEEASTALNFQFGVRAKTADNRILSATDAMFVTLAAGADRTGIEEGIGPNVAPGGTTWWSVYLAIPTVTSANGQLELFDFLDFEGGDGVFFAAPMVT